MKKILAVVSLIFASTYLFAGTLVYTPTLMYPENNTDYLMPLLQLDWNAVAGSVEIYYEIELDVDESFSNPEVFTTELTSYDLPLLLLNQSYYWRVRAIDGDDVSGWSEERVFHVIDKFSNYKPNDNKKDLLPIAELKWRTSSSGGDDIQGISYFEVVIDTAADFSSTGNEHIVMIANPDSVVVDNTATMETELLLFNTVYYWKVKAYNDVSETEWSDATSFTTIDQTKLSKPNDEAIVEPVTELKWTSKSWDLFLLQISEDEEFTNPINIVSEDYRYDTEAMPFGQTYYWRVALLSERDTSLWDEDAHDIQSNGTVENNPRYFTVISAPELDFPDNGATNISPTPELEWGAMDGPVEYILQVSLEDETFSNPMEYTLTAENETSTESFQFVQAIDSATLVYWRVKAIITPDNESDWSEEWSFRIKATGIEEANGNDIVVYPNPSNGQFTVSFDKAEGENVQLQVLDMVGKVVYEESLNFANGSVQNINTTLPEGIYILQLRKGDETYTDKITIR